MIEGVVRGFIDAYRSLLAGWVDRDPVLRRFLSALATVDPLRAVALPGREVTHPTLQHLDRALAGLRGPAAMTRSVRNVIPYLSWGSSYDATGPGAVVARTMVWGEVAGRRGLVQTDDIRLGCFLLSPGLFYPLHGHQALEIYSVVSGAMTVEHGLDDRSRMRVEAPGYSVTPEGEAHALLAGADPVLIVYCWTGDLEAPIWWWDQAADGSWLKTFPPLVRK